VRLARVTCALLPLLRGLAWGVLAVICLAGQPVLAQNEAEAAPPAKSKAQEQAGAEKKSEPASQPAQPVPPPAEKDKAGGQVAPAAGDAPAAAGNAAEAGAPVGPQPPSTAPGPAGAQLPAGTGSGADAKAAPPGASAGDGETRILVEPPSGTVNPPGGATAGNGLPSTAGPQTETGQLPEIAQEQLGFIPDKSPGDLFAGDQPPVLTPDVQRVSEFKSLLGESKLPPETVAELIKQYQDNPANELDDNFARVVVPTGEITGSTESKQFHIEGGLVVFYNDVTITGDTADIDEKNELAVITGNVNILDPKYTLKTDELRIFFDDKRFEAKGFVQFNKLADDNKKKPDMTLGNKDRLREYMAGQHFELYCNQLFYNWDTKEMAAVESVRLVHPSFNGTMERMDYNDDTKDYEMSGGIVLTVDKYDWIFETKVVAAADEKKVKAITDKPTKITCDRLVYSEKTGVAQFYAKPDADVVFDQTTRKLTASYVEVNDETKDFYAEGNDAKNAKYEQQDGEWLFNAELLKRETASTDLQAALDGPLTAEMHTMAYNYERKRIELQGGVNMTSGQRSLISEELIQDDTAKYFLIRGNVHIKTDSQSEVMAAQVYIDTANDVMTFVGLVQGEMLSNDLRSDEEVAPGAAGEAGYQAAQGLFRQQAGQPGGAGNAGTGNAPGGAAGRQGSSTNSNNAEG
jgi:lipopolysaccharide export system protein LptA